MADSTSSSGPVVGAGAAAVAGALSVAGGLATAELVAGALGLAGSPVLAVGEAVIALTPGPVAETAISAVGQADKPLLIAGTVIGALAVGAAAGLLSWRRRWAGFLVLAASGAFAGWAALRPADAGSSEVFPAAAATLVAAVLLGWLVPSPQPSPLPSSAVPVGVSRRDFVFRAGLVTLGAVTVGVSGRLLGAGRRAVESARSVLALPVTTGRIHEEYSVGVPGVARWRTPNDVFYRIDTALSVPVVLPHEWRLRVHGLVERELDLRYRDLLDRGLVHAWITLCCVSNEVGGPLISNAWWSGVPIADLLAEAGVDPSADAVLSTSADGWTCGTPLTALTDGRPALLAVAMNGVPLPVEHGFPVRMVVPGLYGYVSATKWVVELRVSRFADITAYWTERGWSARGPVKTQSRIDTPRDGATVAQGSVAVAGVAWAQHRGIQQVEVRVDDGPWQTARLAAVPGVDTWRQWVLDWTATPGEHTLAVRATDRTGATQTGRRQGVLPDGATGWHTIAVTVR